MKNTLLVSMFALLPAWAGAGAAEREWMPYAKLVGTIKLDKFYALPPAARDKVSLYATVAPANKNIPLSELVLTVVHGAGRQALPITADGKLYIVPNPAWIREDAKIWTSLPKSEKVSVGFGMDALLPDGQQWQYSKLMGSVQQGNDLIKSQAGMLSIFMPTLRSVILKFAKPAQLRIEGKDGTKLYASDAKGWIRLKPESAWMREDPAMLVSERPVEAELDTE